MPIRPHKHFPGCTSESDLIGPVAMESIDNMQLLGPEKHAQFWQNRKLRVGGKADDDKDVESSGDAASDMDIEEDEKRDDNKKNDQLPVTPWELPPVVYETLWHMYGTKVVIDLSPEYGKKACITLADRIGYIGVCHSQTQLSMIESRLQTTCWQQMQTSGSKLFKPEFASFMEKHCGPKNKGTGIKRTTQALAPPPPKPLPNVEDPPAAVAKATTTGSGTPAVAKSGGESHAGEPPLPPNLAQMLKAARELATDEPKDAD